MSVTQLSLIFWHCLIDWLIDPPVVRCFNTGQHHGKLIAALNSGAAPNIHWGEMAHSVLKGQALQKNYLL